MGNNCTDKKIGLALGGGSTKAFATFAVVEGLLEEGIVIDAVSGTSAGAIIGAHYALFGEVKTLREELESFSKKDWFKFADFTFGRTKSMIKAKKYRKYLHDKFGDNTFDDTKVPLIVTASNIVSGKVEYITEGKIVDAIIASSAYPGIFPPFQRGEDLLVDGGVLNNLPYGILFKKKMDKVIGINLGIIGGDKGDYKTSISVLSRALDLMMDNAFRRIYTENDELFVFDVKFKRGFTSTWNVSNLAKKYDVGKTEFEVRKEDFLKWLCV